MSRMLKAVVFDMDGVIVDTEPVNRGRVLAYIRHYNAAVADKDLNDIVGRGKKEVWQIIANVTGVGMTPQAMMEKYHHQWTPLHNEKVDYRALFRPSVKTVLDYARAHGLKTAVASSTAYEKVKSILTEVGIFALMDEVTSGEDCTQPKPRPDVYLETAGKLGVRPEECLVIEDSTVGIEAAHRAGAFVAALIDDRFPFDRAKADAEIADIADVVPILASNQENGA